MPVGTRNTVINGLGVHHIAIQARNLEASLKLYRDVLGMQVVAQFGPPDQPIFLLDVGDGSHIELFAPKADMSVADTVESGDPMIHLAFAASDTRTAIEHIRQAGYEITAEPNSIELSGMQVTYAFFKGPNGEVLELFQTQS